MIDGASPFRILRSVIVPLSVPAIVAVSLFHFFFAWNDFFVPLLYLGEQAGAPAAVDRDPAVQRPVLHAADAHPGGGAHDDGRPGRRLLPRPAGVHARRRGDRRREVSAGGRLARHPVGRLAPPDRPPLPRRRAPPGRPADDRRRPVGRRSRSAASGRGASAGRIAATSHAGISRSAGTGSARSRRTGSRSSSGVRASPGRATVLSTLRPDGPPRLGLDAARGRRHVPRPLPAGVADVRAERARRPARRRAAQPGHRRRPRVERAAGRGLRVVGREPGPGPADGRDHAHAGRTRPPIPASRRSPVPGTKPSVPMTSTGRSSTPRSVRRRVYAGRSPSRRPARPA